VPQKYQKNQVDFRKAVKLYAVRFNNRRNKTLNKLMKNFNIVQVSKLIEIFSNEWIKIPDYKKIWMVFRNKKIRDELDKIDTNDKAAVRNKKQELVTLFDVSFSRVSAIYIEESARASGDFDNVDRIANRIYREEFLNFQKEVEEILDIQPILDTKKRPPIIPY